MVRIGRGDRSAIKLLYERHAPGLTQFIRARSSDPLEAADVVHDAFLEVWRTAGRFEGRSSVKTWIYAIARFNHIDRMRRRGREVPLDEDFEAPDLSPGPHTLMEAASDAARVRECIEKLPPAQCAAVKLAYFEEMSYEEIAAIEGIPEGTVKTRVFHAKKLLKLCLARLIRAR